jgi:hypothetical protein
MYPRVVFILEPCRLERLLGLVLPETQKVVVAFLKIETNNDFYWSELVIVLIEGWLTLPLNWLAEKIPLEINYTSSPY